MPSWRIGVLAFPCHLTAGEQEWWLSWQLVVEEEAEGQSQRGRDERDEDVFKESNPLVNHKRRKICLAISSAKEQDLCIRHVIGQQSRQDRVTCVVPVTRDHVFHVF